MANLPTLWQISSNTNSMVGGTNIWVVFFFGGGGRNPIDGELFRYGTLSGEGGGAEIHGGGGEIP